MHPCLQADEQCPLCGLRAARTGARCAPNERSTGKLLEVDACYDYCTPCRVALQASDDAPSLAGVADAEAESVRWLIGEGRGHPTTAHKTHVCYRCGGVIEVGARYRRLRGAAARVDVALHETCYGAGADQAPGKP